MAHPRSFPRAASFAAILHLFDRHDEQWQRGRLWGPMQALVATFALVEPGRATSYQSACATANAWAGRLFDWDPVHAPDPAGFKRARDRVEEAESSALLRSAQDLAHRSVRARKKRHLCGLPVIAFDGSTLHMPRSPELVREYGVPKDSLGLETCHYPQARLMSAWDLERRIPIAWELGSYTDGERAMALDLLSHVPRGAVCVFDRGFPSREFFGEILNSGRHFVARMVSSEAAAWAEVTAFLKSGRRDAIVTVWVGTGEFRRQVRVRLILRSFDRGRPCKHQKRETMVIITSLTNAPLSARDLCRLYGERWGIETLYREMKAVAKIEQWHGRSKALVRQELILLLVWFCFAAIFATAACCSRSAVAGIQAEWRANTRRVFEAIASVMDAMLALLVDPQSAGELIRRADAAILCMCRWLLRRRPGRSFPRVPLHPYARRL